jgi:hypothetical protein
VVQFNSPSKSLPPSAWRVVSSVGLKKRSKPATQGYSIGFASMAETIDVDTIMRLRSHASGRFGFMSRD